MSPRHRVLAVVLCEPGAYPRHHFPKFGLSIKFVDRDKLKSRKNTKNIKREKLESADSMIPNPMGVVQFNSFKNSRAKIKQTVADKIWSLNVALNFVGLRATELFQVTQFVLV